MINRFVDTLILNKRKIVSLSLSLSYLSVFAALLIPYNFPLFPIFVFINLMLVFVNFKNISFIYFRSYIFLFYILYLIIYFFSITLYSYDLFDYYTSDYRNSITCSLLLFSSIILIRDFEHFKQVIEILLKQLFFVSLIASFLGLLKFFLSLNGVFIEFFRTSEGLYPLGTSLLNDYNIFSFGLFFGLIIGISFLDKNQSMIVRFFLWLSVSMIFISIALTGSRRSLVILFIFFIVFLYLEFRVYLHLFIVQIKKGVLRIRFFRPITFIFLLIIFFSYLITNSNFEFSEVNQFEKILIRAESLNETEGSFSQRTKRWQLSSKILNSMNMEDLLFGRGYQYWLEFVPSNKQNIGTDYPHNLFISTFFSSGIIGLLTIIILFIYAFKVYQRNFRFLAPFFIGFLISFIYLFISGDQFFSNKAIVLLVYFPIILEIKLNGKV